MWLEGVVAAGAVFCGMMAVYYRWMVRKERRAIAERISGWMEQRDEEISWSDSLVERLDRTEWAQKLKPHLERAVIKLRPAEFMAYAFLAGAALIFFLYKGFGLSLLFSFFLAITLVPAGVRLLFLSRRNIYAARINAQLPEVCRLLSSAARAGLSIPQGLEIVVKEMSPPIKNELDKVYREVQLGRNLETALRDMLKRVNSRDLQVFVNALIIQRRAGGDLARVLSEMARTMEERKIINQTIQSLTAQSRFTAYMLPLASVLIVFLLSKLMGGLGILFESFLGILLVIVFLVAQVIGIFLVWKISNIRV